MGRSQKGRRREHEARDILLKDKHLVTRSAGSLGTFDLLAISAPGRGKEGPTFLRLVQVKSNRFPKPKERAEMEKVFGRIPKTLIPVVEIWRFDDYKGIQILRLAEDGWLRLLNDGKNGERVLALQRDKPRGFSA